MSSNIGDLIPRLEGRHVLVVGDLMLDEYVKGDCTRISPEAPVPVIAFESFRTAPGGVANTALNVAALGGRATLLGVTGDDEAGRQLTSACEDAGIRALALRDGGTTTRKVRVLAHQQQLFRLYYERKGGVAGDTITAVL